MQKPLARVLIAKPRSNVRSCQAKSFLDDHAELAIRRAVAQLVGVGVLGTGAVGAVGFRQLQQVLYDSRCQGPTDGGCAEGLEWH